MLRNSHARTVCVTGANGYLASHIVARCLAKGCQVNGTVRCSENDEKTRHLREMPGAQKGLTLFRAELLAENSPGFQDAVSGCDTVFHTASPHHDTMGTQDVHAAIFGTLAVLRACKAAGVKTVVMTSDICTSMPESKSQTRCESQWSDPALLMKRGELYAVSKTLSEKAAWRFMEQESPGFRLVTLLPARIVGPSLSNNGGSGSLNFRLMKDGNGEKYPNESVGLVDVRDCTEHHIAAMESESANGRYFSTAGSWPWNGLCPMMKEINSEMFLTKQCSIPSATSMFDFSKKELEHMLGRTLERLDASLQRHEERMISILQQNEPNGEVKSAHMSFDNDFDWRSRPESPCTVVSFQTPCFDRRTRKANSPPGTSSDDIITDVSYDPTPSVFSVIETESFDQIEILKKTNAFSKFVARFSARRKTTPKSSRCLANELRLRRFVNSRLFARSIAVAIICNSVTIGMEVNERGNTVFDDSLERPPFYRWVGWFFTLLFAMELILRIVVFRFSFLWPSQQGELFWNLFDSFVVVTSTVSFIFEEALPDETYDRSLGALKVASAFRIFRVLRLLRVLRIVRLLGVCTSLRILILAIAGAIKQCGHLFTLLFLVIYVFTVILVHTSLDSIASSGLYNTHYDVQKDELWQSFGTLPRGLSTMFQSITGGCDWGIHQDELSKVNSFSVAIYNFYILAVIVVLMNVMTGLFCQSALTAASTDEKEALMLKRQENKRCETQLRKIFEILDNLSTCSPQGTFSLNELEKSFQDPIVGGLFASLEIDTEDAWTLFKLLDTAQQGYVEIDQFLEGCQKCRGVARSMDTHLLRYEMQWLMNLTLNVARKLDVMTNRKSLGKSTSAPKPKG